MYAVIETGGKQYRVELGTELQVELLDAEPGGTITLDRVLLVADGDAASIGRPLVESASVAAEVLRQERGEKVISFKYRPKARRRVKKGHRQELTVLRISDIILDGKSAAASEKKATEARKTERERLEEAAKRQADADAALAAKLAKDAAAKAPKAKADTKTATKSTSKGTAKAAPTTTAKAAPKADASAAKATKSTKASKAPASTPKRARTTKKDE
jgi:large subunit ribosomal protein L21